MRYIYKKLTVSQYLIKLYEKGLKKSNYLTQEEIENKIQDIGIFKIKGYIKSFRKRLFYYSIDDVLELYEIDREISSKLFFLSSQIEIKLKAYLIDSVYELTDNPFFYLLKTSYIENFELNNDSIFGWEIKQNYSITNEELYLHYQEYYLKNYSFELNKEYYLFEKNLIIDKNKNINYPPFHYFVENLTLGSLIKLLSKLKIEDKILLKVVAKKFGFYNEKVFLNYLLRVKELRNRCAHNGRLFNRNYRSIKASGFYKELRKEIYHYRLLDVYYTLLLLLDNVNNIKNSNDLELQFKNRILGKVSDKLTKFLMNNLKR